MKQNKLLYYIVRYCKIGPLKHCKNTKAPQWSKYKIKEIKHICIICKYTYIIYRYKNETERIHISPRKIIIAKSLYFCTMEQSQNIY